MFSSFQCCINPPAHDTESSYNLPTSQVIKDFTPTSFDEILLFADDYVKILERGEVSEGVWCDVFGLWCGVVV